MTKNTFVSVLLLMAVIISFSSILDESIGLSEQISQVLASEGLNWRASPNIAFFSPYVEANPRSVSELLNRINGYLPLNEEARSQWLSEIVGHSASRMNTTNDMILSTYVVLKPVTQTEASFFRIEPVRNQQYYGSCWAFSTIGTFESALAVQALGLPEGNRDNRFDYSERWVGYHNNNTFIRLASNAWMIQDEDRLNGGNPYHALFNSIRYGEMEEQNAPYAQIFISTEEGVPLPTSAYGAPLRQSSKTALIPSARDCLHFGYTYADYLNMIKTALKDYGSLSVTFAVPGDFGNYASGIYTPVLPLSESYHAVTLVGWAAASELDDISLNGKLKNPPVPIIKNPITRYTYRDFTLPGVPQHATDLFWILKNSYGYLWGDAGYYVVPAINAAQYAGEAEIGLWMIEGFDMYVPLFDSDEKHAGDDLDINRDGLVDQNDFGDLIAKIGSNQPSDISACDIGYPKDGRITGDDASAWITLYNVRHEE